CAPSSACIRSSSSWRRVQSHAANSRPAASSTIVICTIAEAMFNPEALKQIAAAKERWEREELRQFTGRQPETRNDCHTASGLPVERVYTPLDVADTPFDEIGLPGTYPFTRGP